MFSPTFSKFQLVKLLAESLDISDHSPFNEVAKFLPRNSRTFFLRELSEGLVRVSLVQFFEK